MLASNTILQNRYRIVRQLGQGGMGTVYEAIDESVSCVVALKERLATNDPEGRRAFEREAALLANLRHPLLPKVMHHFTDDEGQFLVMEYIHGYDLAELLDVRGTPFAQAQVLNWADELLKVLEYLHERQPPILHRDIKPSNLKLTKQGEIVLLDFGLAKGAAGQMPTLLTSRSVRGYTPVYAPLEQIHGQGTEPRSDLYSLGATLYHLLTGIQPTNAPTRFTALEDDRADPLRPIDEINPLVPSAIAAVIHQAMEMSRKNRPASAAMMRKALCEADEAYSRQEQAFRPNKQEETPEGAEQAVLWRREAEIARFATEGDPIRPGAAIFNPPKTTSGTLPPKAFLGKPIGDSEGIEMVWIPPGSFDMGSNNGEADEKPVHRVAIPQGFYMGKYVVTQGQWQALMGSNPSTFKGDDNLPVEEVSWNDAQDFIKKLNGMNDGYKYRLPTEAEWEYACRAGTTGDHYARNVDDVAWFSPNSGKKTRQVGTKQANAFGLYDMHGNVWEWCCDWYVDSYEGAPTDGSARLSGGEQKYRVLRGGSWGNLIASYLRSAYRSFNAPDFHGNGLSFRLVAVERTR